MKLERMMKKYYAGKVDAAILPGIPGRMHPGAARPARQWSDLALSFAVHALLALIVMLGLPGLRGASPLSAEFSRIAAEMSLDKYIDSRVKLLTDSINIIRNTR